MLRGDRYIYIYLEETGIGYRVLHVKQPPAVFWKLRLLKSFHNISEGDGKLKSHQIPCV